MKNTLNGLNCRLDITAESSGLEDIATETLQKARQKVKELNNKQDISELGDPVCVIWNFQEVGGKTLLPIKGSESEVQSFFVERQENMRNVMKDILAPS